MVHKPDQAGDITTLYGSVWGSDADNQWFGLYFDHESLGLIGAANDATLIAGHQDAIGFIGGNGQIIEDDGTGTSITVYGDAHLTVYHYQNDPTGVIQLPSETTSPLVQSDGNGGTLLTTGAGATMLFVGAIVPASQIISSVPPTMAFVAPAPDPPAPAPTDPPIVVTGLNQMLSLDGTLPAGQFHLTYAGTPITGPTTVDDQGTGTTIWLSNACQITLQDFAMDHTGQVIFQSQTLTDQATGDGNGGTVVTCGVASVDFVGMQFSQLRIGVEATPDGVSQLLHVHSAA